MTQWLEDLSTLQVLLLVVAVLLGGSVLAALLGALLVNLSMVLYSRDPRKASKARKQAAKLNGQQMKQGV